MLIGWKQPFIIEGQKNIGSDRVLTPEKAPYKVEGYYFYSRRGQMTTLTGYLGDKKVCGKNRTNVSFGWLPLERRLYISWVEVDKRLFSVATT